MENFYITGSYPYLERTVRRDGRHQITCLCGGYPFPHRFGGGLCEFREDKAACPTCDSGYGCDVHGTYADWPQTETLSAAQRNPGLNEAMKRGRW